MNLKSFYIAYFFLFSFSYASDNEGFNNQNTHTLLSQNLEQKKEEKESREDLYKAKGTFKIQNNTRNLPYKDSFEGNKLYANPRIRMTFHKSPESLEWLNKNQLEVPKIFIPASFGEVSDSCDIDYPGKTSDSTQYLTFYLTVDSKELEEDGQVKKYFLCGKTVKLSQSEDIENVYIIFNGIKNTSNKLNELENIFNDMDIEIKVNGKEITQSQITSTDSRGYNIPQKKRSSKKVTKKRRLNNNKNDNSLTVASDPK